MYSTTHLALGLIIGEITGDYTASLIGSLAIDIDHLIPAIRQNNIFNFKKIWLKSKSSKDSSRSYFHSFFSWAFFSLVIMLINFRFGLVFSLAYLGHFLLDALDNSDFYPFYPFKKINIRGFIPYYSRQELIFSLFLFTMFVLL
ncbi:MAG: metal-dependent hydrolase [Patescibacteria group bacterium]|jgi:membrane-bound metal-dependent hydrolase YbcI (DUF457 family)